MENALFKFDFEKKHADSLAFWALNDAEWSSLCAEFTGPLTTYYEKIPNMLQLQTAQRDTYMYSRFLLKHMFAKWLWVKYLTPALREADCGSTQHPPNWESVKNQF